MKLTEIRFGGEVSGRETIGTPRNPVTPILLKRGTSEVDAIRIAKGLGSMLGHFHGEVRMESGRVEKISI